MKLTDDSIIGFGKYKGRKLINIPPSYLLWLINDVDDKIVSGRSEDVKDYIKENINNIKSRSK